MIEKMSAAHRIVLTFAGITVLGWLLGVAGISHLPSAGYAAADLAFDALIVVALWLLWRPAWIIAVVVTLLGELLLVIHPGGHVAVLVVGLAQLVVLALPQLRRELGRRPARA